MKRMVDYIAKNIKISKISMLLYSPTGSIGLSLLQNKITYKITVNFFYRNTPSLNKSFVHPEPLFPVFKYKM